jgi:hypothetical protein
MAGEKQEVVVTDIKVHFWSMVVLMVEWALAAIPALVILYVAAVVIAMILDAVFGLGLRWWGPRTI